VLLFARDPGFVCAVNLSDEPVWLDVRGTVLLSSGRVRDGELGPDAAVWWACP
jgi:alpha-glucosidase